MTNLDPTNRKAAAMTERMCKLLTNRMTTEEINHEP